MAGVPYLRLAARARRLLIVFCLGCCAFGQSYYRDQEVHIQNSPTLAARSTDPTDVLLTSLHTVFHDPEVCCGKDSALEDSARTVDPDSLKDIAEKLKGRHVLSDGREAKVTTEFFTSEQLNAGHLIVMLTEQHAPLLIWNSHLYVVRGATYDKIIDYTDGYRETYSIHKILLWDLRYSDSRRETAFDRATDDFNKVQGFLFLQATLE
jgi:hypothetical protein